MFTVLKFDAKRGTFSEVSSHSDLHQALPEMKKRHSTASPHIHIITWSNSQGLSGREEDDMLQTVLDANEGRILRVMKNAIVQLERLNEARVCCGAGSNCYCVQYANGTRQCEAQYCNANGYCWWVPCSVPCGC